MIVIHCNSGISMLRICLALMALHKLSGFGISDDMRQANRDDRR
jgi:hypothetical protein